MAFLSYSDIQAQQNLAEARNAYLSSAVLTLSADPGAKDIFLSHSTADDDLVPGIVLLFQQRFGASTYHDAGDWALPAKVSPATAVLLRSRISQCRRFIVLVTPRSKDSRWVPWELGLADGAKGQQHTAVLPITPSGSEDPWASQEYLGIYPRIINSVSAAYDLSVRDPLKTASVPFQQWLA